MGLFYFRKSIKTFFKRLIYYYKYDIKISKNELMVHVKDTIESKYKDKYSDIADGFFYFIYDKDFKDKWWNAIEFEKCSKIYINYETLKLHNQLHKPNPCYDKFEILVKNDLKQMYRLRNMSAHSGILDNKMLINTFDRLKYYVETLLNSISYVWLEQSQNGETIFDINDLKRVDWEDYKKNKNFGVRDINNAIQYVNYKGLVKIPPNRFSFL